MKILIINGPNLNLLGKREPEIYGAITFESYLNSLKNKYPGINLDYYQSNVEGFLIDKLQEASTIYDGIVLNAGAYTHTSIAIADAIRSIKTPIIEVHISNVYKREDYRKKSFISPHCTGIIIGFGLKSYQLAIEYLTNQ